MKIMSAMLRSTKSALPFVTARIMRFVVTSNFVGATKHKSVGRKMPLKQILSEAHNCKKSKIFVQSRIFSLTVDDLIWL